MPRIPSPLAYYLLRKNVRLGFTNGRLPPWYSGLAHPTRIARAVARFGPSALRFGGVGLAASAGYYTYKSLRSRNKSKALMPTFGQTRRQRAREAFVEGSRIYPDGGTYENSRRRKRARSDSANGGSNPSVATMAKVVSGRYKSFKQKALSLLRSSLVPYVDRFGTLTSTYDAANQNPLCYKVFDSLYTQYPVYLMELNTNPLGSGINIGAPLQRLARYTATGNYAFLPVGTATPDNTGSTFAYSVEYQADGSTAAYGYAHSYFLDWCDIRVSCVGPRKTPSRFSMKLVQFTDDSFQPDCYSTVINTPSTAPTVTNGRPRPVTDDDLIEWNGYWQEYTAKLLGNPLNMRRNSVGEKMKVMKQYSCMFQPRLTTEDSITGGTGDTKHVKWFNRVAKCYTYATATNPTTVTTAEEIDPIEQNPAQSANGDTHARPRARLFLLIEGYTPVAADGTTDRAISDVACQFDIVVRRKFYFTDRQ